ncbi:hypothetical protein DUNSADRAFT_5287 [Dunaliella salina]|uniref:Right handed beta helix domain-containing protein n=1 Tax=Dunaliella salina TaxID=3046 RepID=A0ABQ7GQL2_DUNSA|nr:hypothetical protein DUNSADRAFT_5287 [Dunaliella salina]|eukprot:KAF5836895.1 hypothetical protein DUNSADRAFT_5287 [Dunaliella salina]
MRTVELRQCTRTLRFPSLQDVYDIITSHDASTGLLHIDLKQLTVGGDVKGLAVSHVPNCKAIVEKHFVIAAGTNVHISNGTLDIPPACALMLSGTNVSFSNVAILGPGLQKHHRETYLICVHGANSHATFDDCNMECQSRHSNANTLVVCSGATCTMNGTRLVASRPGNALKIQGGHVICSRHSLIQGGVFVTAGGLAAKPAPQIDASKAQWHRSKGGMQSRGPLSRATVDDTSAQQQQQQQQQDPQQGQQEHHRGGVGTHESGGDVAAVPDQGQHGEAEHRALQGDDQGLGVEGDDVEVKHELHAACVPTGGSDDVQEANCGRPDQQQQQQQQQASSRLQLESSEIRGGTVSSMAVFGSGSRISALGCMIGGTNFGCHAAKHSNIELVGCEVTSSVSAAVVTGGSTLIADKCTLEGGKIGLQVERKGAAHLTLCKINSQSAPAVAPEVLPAPSPGFLPDFHTTAAGIEVRHEGSYVTVIDSKVGQLEGQLGELGVHCIAGGRFFLEAGVASAMEGVRGQFHDFV